jgi:hypothetical protein
MPTITLTVYLYDLGNAPLQHSGIQIDLHNAVTNKFLAKDVSRDLNPGSVPASNEWGGELTYSSVGDPVDIIFTDAKYEYPGNTLRYLNGETGGRIDVDLQKVPTGKGGQASPPRSSSPPELSRWVDDGKDWTRRQKQAVKSLVLNYIAMIVVHDDDPSRLQSLAHVARNWGEALDRLGIPPELLHKQ